MGLIRVLISPNDSQVSVALGLSEGSPEVLVNAATGRTVRKQETKRLVMTMGIL
jgi:hypothetical protein